MEKGLSLRLDENGKLELIEEQSEINSISIASEVISVISNGHPIAMSNRNSLGKLGHVSFGDLINCINTSQSGAGKYIYSFEDSILVLSRTTKKGNLKEIRIKPDGHLL